MNFRFEDLPLALECPICRSALTQPVLLQPCAHLFCKGCLKASLKASPICPLDRLPVRLSDISRAPRNLQDLLDDLFVVCEACDWSGRRAEDHDCHAEAGAPPTASTSRLLPCPQSTRGCAVRLTSDELKLHIATCPFEALSAYFDMQDARAKLLQGQITTLSTQVEKLDERLSAQAAESTILKTSIEAVEVRGQISVMEESFRSNHELTALRAGLDGVRRQLFALMLEREQRLGLPGPRLSSSAQPPQPPQRSSSTTKL